MTVIINDTLDAFGGSHTLLLRMCRWLNLNHVNVYVFCTNVSNFEIADSLKQIDVPIKVIGNYNLNFLKDALCSIYKNENDFLVINFSFEKWLDMESVKSMTQFEIKNIIYDIHPKTFHKGLSIPFFRNLLKNYYKKLLMKAYNNNSIVTMEEINIKSTIDYYNLSFNEYYPMILRLPMICIDSKNFENIILNGFDSNIIMTASRAEFPYKGYLLGLIYDFIKISELFPNTKLLIITSGESVNLIMKKIKELPINVQKNIEIKSWVLYDELLSSIQKCKLFIGMGTTVLDSALQYKPVVTSAFNTYENLTTGLFSNNPTVLGGNYKISFPAIDLIKNILSLDFNSYKNICLDSFRSVMENYNIDKIMPCFLSLNLKKDKCVLSKFEIFIHRMHILINQIRYRNTLKVDFFSQYVTYNKT